MHYPQAFIEWQDTDVIETVSNSLCGDLEYIITHSSGIFTTTLATTPYKLGVYTNNPSGNTGTFNLAITVEYKDYPAISDTKFFTI